MMCGVISVFDVVGCCCVRVWMIWGVGRFVGRVDLWIWLLLGGVAL